MTQADAAPSAPLAILGQIFALVFGSLAAMWGFFCVYWSASPGPCGDSPGPGLLVLESWVLDVPIGLLVLATGWFVRKGSSRMRTICIVISLVTLLLPAMATWLLQRRHCP